MADAASHGLDTAAPEEYRRLCETTEAGSILVVRDHLFAPLGMSQTRLKVDKRGHAWTYADMETTTRDSARIGMLILAGGTWGGQRIVSDAYVRAATTPTATERRMGFLWWILSSPQTLGGFAARGYLHNDLYVFPEERLVIARTQAPKGGYTGLDEAAGYEEAAFGLLRRIVGK